MRLVSRLPKRTLYIFLIVLGGLILIRFLFTGKPSSQSSKAETEDIKPAKAVQSIDREFKFPLKDSGEDVSDIKFFIDDAELREEIVVQGQKAVAVPGRIFLIVTIKISNSYEQAITMNTRDYVRLIVDGNQEEKLAPDIHNDPVEIQAISTKQTRLGFAIDDNDKPLSLQVGEIEGDKETIELDLRK